MSECPLPIGRIGHGRASQQVKDHLFWPDEEKGSKNSLLRLLLLSLLLAVFAQERCPRSVGRRRHSSKGIRSFALGLWWRRRYFSLYVVSSNRFNTERLARSLAPLFDSSEGRAERGAPRVNRRSTSLPASPASEARRDSRAAPRGGKKQFLDRSSRIPPEPRFPGARFGVVWSGRCSFSLPKLSQEVSSSSPPLSLFLLYYFQSVRYCPRFTRKTAVLALLSGGGRERASPLTGTACVPPSLGPDAVTGWSPW